MGKYICEFLKMGGRGRGRISIMRCTESLKTDQDNLTFRKELF